MTPEIYALTAFCLVSTLFNLGLSMMNLKLYTEFAKQRMQENRKDQRP